MEQASWSDLATVAVITAVALVLRITVKPGREDPGDAGYILRRYARNIGLMVGIVGCIVALQLLLMLLMKE